MKVVGLFCLDSKERLSLQDNYYISKMKKIFLLIICIVPAIFMNAQYTKLLDFAGVSNGKNPYGDVISDGTFLYGMTNLGGANNDGVIFKVKQDGTGYSTLLDFAGTLNGANPHGSLISDGIFLYGMTSAGGANNDGLIFKIKPDGTAYATLLDFAGTTNGKSPFGSLMYDGSFLFGMTRLGGINDSGIVFKIKTDGTGYVKLIDFAGSVNGRNPQGGLISDGTYLYGMTSKGGTFAYGTIFKVKTDGTGYTNILNLDGSFSGAFPKGSLIFDGTFLYGEAWYGGSAGEGVIFKIKPDGTGYTKLFDFLGVSNGAYPYGSLVYDGTYLYGMTEQGCVLGSGLAFKIKTDGTGYYRFFDFTNATGSNPNGSFIIDGGFLYGMTFTNGANVDGSVFKLGLTTGISENSINNQISIFPNPSDGNLTINYSLKQNDKASLTIFDMTEKLVYETNLDSDACKLQLNGNLKNGIYLYRLIVNNSIMKSDKLVIVNK